MSEFEPVGQTHATKTYNQGKTQRSPRLRPSGRLLKKPPVIIPEELPGTTMRRILHENILELSADYQSIIGYLTTYQRQGENRRWDEFRNKIPPPLLKLWGDTLIECRRNGFVGPRAENGKILWRQAVSTNDIQNGDLCTMCERECRRREKINSGEWKWIKSLNKDTPEQRSCWQ